MAERHVREVKTDALLLDCHNGEATAAAAAAIVGKRQAVFGERKSEWN